MRNMINCGNSCQDLVMLHGTKTSKYVRTCMVFAWLARNMILARFPKKTNHDMARYNKLQNLKCTFKQVLARTNMFKHDLLGFIKNYQNLTGIVGKVSSFFLIKHQLSYFSPHR